jgi:hypothetical protein
LANTIIFFSWQTCFHGGVVHEHPFGYLVRVTDSVMRVSDLHSDLAPV